jgi:hypothetical protein
MFSAFKDYKIFSRRNQIRETDFTSLKNPSFRTGDFKNLKTAGRTVVKDQN